jgi:hypothetical protein
VLAEGLYVSHDQFVASHGKKAGGHGSWIFSKKSTLNFDKHKEGVDYHQATGMFSAVAKDAAKKLNTKFLHVQP